MGKHVTPFVSCKDNKTKMVKTKQTAKKTTGGRAPRVSLAGLKAREKQAAKSSKAHARKAPVAKKRRMKNLARMEGHCGLVIRQVAEGGHPASCDLQGFYLSGKPVLTHPLVVIGGFEHATTSEVAGNSTAIIHLHLESLELGHAPLHILHTMLQGYFTQDTFHFSHLPFNFATEESRAAYDTATSELASSLTTFAKVVIFLTTHTDEDRGDLFSGMENKVPIATEVFELQFLQGLLLPFSNIVKGGDLIFFVCGSTVRKEESFQGLKAAVQHSKPRSMLLFDAERLQLVTTIPFLMSILDSTLVQGFHVQSAVRHSNIILMLWQEKVQRGYQTDTGKGANIILAVGSEDAAGAEVNIVGSDELLMDTEGSTVNVIPGKNNGADHAGHTLLLVGPGASGSCMFDSIGGW
ncbi:hypothetical protein BKA82DRAFT_4019107 [Pisolithus tinctorius]|nr:hypothetical protein BKA82DRAFT_4019107 [Pisolithus tinctorius]